MEIWLLRHAAAEDQSVSGRDADRTLTEDGHRRARQVARGLAVLEPEIEVILTSPYHRARQTAEPFARALRVKLRESRGLEPGRDPDEILGEIREEGLGSVLLVGHEPHLGNVLGRLISGRSGLTVPMKKAAIARLSWEGSGQATLRAVLPPKVLESLASKRD
ncbi:MAG TPA: phosphohistidine phosphatase SixA [Thermoanaerobaculia bacterium]|jgi:phosphohistidine phosphatase